jgi:hypothetical protein
LYDLYFHTNRAFHLTAGIAIGEDKLCVALETHRQQMLEGYQELEDMAVALMNNQLDVERLVAKASEAASLLLRSE